MQMKSLRNLYIKTVYDPTPLLETGAFPNVVSFKLELPQNTLTPRPTLNAETLLLRFGPKLRVLELHACSFQSNNNNNNNDDPPTQHDFADVLSRFEVLEVLKLESCGVIKSLDFLTISGMRGTLRVLLIGTCSLIDERSPMHHLSEMECDYFSDLVHLEELKLNFPIIVSDRLMRSLSGLSNLRDLTLHTAHKLTGKGLVEVLPQLPNLTRLTIGSAHRLGGYSDSSFSSSIAFSNQSLYDNNKMRNLRELTFFYCQNLIDSDFEGIRNLKDTLKILNLYGLKKLTSAGMNENFKHLVNLRELRMRDVGSGDQITSLQFLKNMRRLQLLDLRYCSVTPDAFSVFSENPNSSFQSLDELDLTACAQLTDVAFHHLSQNENVNRWLTVLRMSGAHFAMTNKGVESILKLKGLHRISTSFREDDAKALRLKQGLKNLKWMNDVSIIDDPVDESLSIGVVIRNFIGFIAVELFELSKRMVKRFF